MRFRRFCLQRCGLWLQALCFFAGANSIFAGEKLLTTANPERDRDQALFDRLGIKPHEL